MDAPMDQETAMILLNIEFIPDLDELTDYHDEEIFQQRNFFLNGGAVVPLLWKSKADRILRMELAFQALGVPSEEGDLLSRWNFESEDLLELMNQYVDALSLTRQRIGNSLDGREIAKLAVNIAEAKGTYNRSFLKLTEELDISGIVVPKQGDEFDFGKVMYLINQGLSVKEYLRAEKARLMNQQTI